MRLTVYDLLNYLISGIRRLRKAQSQRKVSPKQLHCINYFVRLADWLDNAIDSIPCYLNFLVIQLELRRMGPEIFSDPCKFWGGWNWNGVQCLTFPCSEIKNTFIATYKQVNFPPPTLQVPVYIMQFRASLPLSFAVHSVTPILHTGNSSNKN